MSSRQWNATLGFGDWRSKFGSRHHRDYKWFSEPWDCVNSLWIEHREKRRSPRTEPGGDNGTTGGDTV